MTWPFSPRQRSPAMARNRHELQWDGPIYAVGDVHGCLAQLQALERLIAADATPGPNLIVMLGDYVDRGPASPEVLDHLAAPPPTGFERICLCGNHEAMMLEHVADPHVPSRWLDNGGLDTLAGYGIDAGRYQAASHGEREDMLASHIPAEHLDFLQALPILVSSGPFVFVHAGIDPALPLPEQADETLLWMRHNRKTPEPTLDRIVVHGHTPAAAPVVLPGRICVDTGCFATGVLTAVRLIAGDAPMVLQTGR